MEETIGHANNTAPGPCGGVLPGKFKKCRPSEVASGNVRDPEACTSDVIKKGKHLLVITTDYDS